MRGWAIELVLIALLVPFIVAIVDLFALCRRQRIGFGRRCARSAAGLLFWLFVGIVFTCFRLLGAWPDGPPRPPNPATAAAGDWPCCALPLPARGRLRGLADRRGVGSSRGG